MVDRSSAQKQPVAMYWLVLAYLLLIALNVWLLWLLPEAPPIEKASFILAIVGIYSLALNFSSATGLFKTYPSWLDDMTSPSLRAFVTGAFRVVSVAFLASSLFVRGFPPPLLPRVPLIVSLLTIPLILVVVVGVVLVTALVTAAYLVVIVPVAYIAYLFASIVLGSVENAPDDVGISSEEGNLKIKRAVQDHRAQLRTLVVALPATIVSIGTTAYSLFP